MYVYSRNSSLDSDPMWYCAMANLRLVDVNNKQRGAAYKQYWFDTEGKFLANQGTKKPYYHYMPPQGKQKRWTRSYHIELLPGTEVIKYVGKGRARWWEVHKVTDEGIEKTEDHQGLPPWIQAWVDNMKAKD